MEYAMTVRAAAPFADTVARVREALKEQGFGVLTEIDVRATMREKLGEEMEDYLILGACNPPLAHRALTADRTIGLLLPCNVVIRAGDSGTTVEALDPRAIAGIAGQPALTAVANEAASRIRRHCKPSRMTDPRGDRDLAGHRSSRDPETVPGPGVNARPARQPPALRCFLIASGPRTPPQDQRLLRGPRGGARPKPVSPAQEAGQAEVQRTV